MSCAALFEQESLASGTSGVHYATRRAAQAMRPFRATVAVLHSARFEGSLSAL